MKIIVTGGAGFIGANFIYYELREHPEDRIVCYDALTYAGNLATLDAEASAVFVCAWGHRRSCGSLCAL